MRHRLSLAVVLLMFLKGATAIAQVVSIHYENGAFTVSGWPAPASPPSGGWQTVFAVYVDTAGVPPLLGTYTIEKRTLIFRPQYPLSPGVHYRAIFQDPNVRASRIETTFSGPVKNTTPSAHVDRMYPSADVLPSNQLRLYVYFSAAMSRGEAARRIHLLDGDNHELTAEFLPGEELWDPNGQRLTLTFDPGRIKRGLTSNQNMGPPITEGRRYTLVIDREWPDAQGVPMFEGFRKAFAGGPAIRVPPDARQWKITPPRAAARDPLIVDFDRAMNYPLLQRMVQVAGPRGRIEGTIAVDRHEAQWRFTPNAPWTIGPYRLIVDTGLEDLAGNRLGQPFDIDVFDRVTEHLTSATVDVPFTVR